MKVIDDENLRSPRSQAEQLGSSKTSEMSIVKPSASDFEIEVDSLGSDNESDSLDGDFGNYDIDKDQQQIVKDNENKELFDESI